MASKYKSTQPPERLNILPTPAEMAHSFFANPNGLNFYTHSYDEQRELRGKKGTRYRLPNYGFTFLTLDGARLGTRSVRNYANDIVAIRAPEVVFYDFIDESDSVPQPKGVHYSLQPNNSQIQEAQAGGVAAYEKTPSFAKNADNYTASYVDAVVTAGSLAQLERRNNRGEKIITPEVSVNLDPATQTYFVSFMLPYNAWERAGFESDSLKLVGLTFHPTVVDESFQLSVNNHGTIQPVFNIGKRNQFITSWEK